MKPVTFALNVGVTGSATTPLELDEKSTLNADASGWTSAWEVIVSVLENAA